MKTFNSPPWLTFYQIHRLRKMQEIWKKARSIGRGKLVSQEPRLLCFWHDQQWRKIERKIIITVIRFLRHFETAKKGFFGGQNTRWGANEAKDARKKRNTKRKVTARTRKPNKEERLISGNKNVLVEEREKVLWKRKQCSLSRKCYFYIFSGCGRYFLIFGCVE